MKQLRAASILMLSFFILTLQTNAFAQAAPRRVIIDTDPGTDDAMAIILALNSPEFKVEALTVRARQRGGVAGIGECAEDRFAGGTLRRCGRRRSDSIR